MSETNVNHSDASPSSELYWEHKARLLAWLTVGWNVTEAIVGLTAAILANSPALLGFGLDSVVESLSSIVMIWRFQNVQHGHVREAHALRLVGASLVVLAAIVLFDASRSFFALEEPGVTYVGIVLACISVVFMPIVAWAKRRVAHRLNSGALHADAKQTDICFYLAAILLVGVGLNALFGWWWADPIAALLMVPLIAYEGIQAFRGRSSCGSC
jgi:divalent metal cation (Fe/Co/Zn/Cd) transporter